jgi:hypothetical protein
MANIANEFRVLAESFSHIIQGLAYLDEDEAGRLAKKYSEKLVLNARSVYKELGEEIAEVMSKPPKVKRRRKKVTVEPVISLISEEVVDNELSVDEIRAQSMEGVGQEELPDNSSTTLINRQVQPEDLGMAVENLQRTLNSKEVTTGKRNPSFTDGRISPQKRIE